jgi:mono/diheme cytochrome c family protein
MMHTRPLVLAAVAALVVAFASLATAATAPPARSPATLARGRALVVFGTCNDCHTPGWREADGAIPVARWMTGSRVGFRGWWGTSYPTNVRRAFATMTEADWIFAVRTRAGHPPMVWQDLRGMPDTDLRAIYAFIHALGPAGGAVPAAVEPWRQPATAVVDMRALPSPAAGAR